MRNLKAHIYILPILFIGITSIISANQAKSHRIEGEELNQQAPSDLQFKSI